MPQPKVIDRTKHHFPVSSGCYGYQNNTNFAQHCAKTYTHVNQWLSIFS